MNSYLLKINNILTPLNSVRIECSQECQRIVFYSISEQNGSSNNTRELESYKYTNEEDKNEAFNFIINTIQEHSSNSSALIIDISKELLTFKKKPKASMK